MEESAISREDIKAKLEQWRKWNYYPCGTVFGPIAKEYGLSFVDATLLSWIRYLSKGTQSHSVEHNGQKYVWMHYQTAIDHNPMMGVSNKLVLGRHMVDMEKKGILLRFDENKADSSRSYFCVPSDVSYFLYATIEHGDDLSRICREWLQWTKTGKMEHLSIIPEDAPVQTAEVPTLSPEFLAFIKKVTDVSAFRPNLYDKEGTPYKGMVALNKWYDALLDGTFVKQFHAVNPDYDYTTIGAVTELEILKAIQKAPAFIDKLPTLILAYKTKRSILLDTIAKSRGKSGGTTYSTVIPDSDKTAMKGDKFFQSGLYWMKKMYSSFDMSDAVVSQLWELQKWYVQFYDDLCAINIPGEYRYTIGKNGFDKMGEFLGTYARITGKSPTVYDLKIDSYWWKKFALYVLKGHRCKILLDESIYRKDADNRDASERLYEDRPYDYSSDSDDCS